MAVGYRVLSQYSQWFVHLLLFEYSYYSVVSMNWWWQPLNFLYEANKQLL